MLPVARDLFDCLDQNDYRRGQGTQDVDHPAIEDQEHGQGYVAETRFACQIIPGLNFGKRQSMKRPSLEMAILTLGG
jgi:hypothetical protein